MSEAQQPPNFSIEFSSGSDRQFQTESRDLLRQLVKDMQNQGINPLKTNEQINQDVNNVFIYDQRKAHKQILKAIGAEPKSLFARTLTNIGKNRGQCLQINSHGSLCHAIFVEDRDNRELLIHELQHAADSILEREIIEDTGAEGDIRRSQIAFGIIVASTIGILSGLASGADVPNVYYAGMALVSNISFLESMAAFLRYKTNPAEQSANQAVKRMRNRE